MRVGVTRWSLPLPRAAATLRFHDRFGSIDEAVGLLKAGAVDFITKPFNLDQLMVRVHQFCEPKRAHDEPVLGLSPTMRKIEALLPRLVNSLEPVLISGESGVGKEDEVKLAEVLLPLRRRAACRCHGGASFPTWSCD